ncbi:MAG TPA: hypothetical protein VI454_01025 [Verrucomicrobiae bacterium]|jgi:DNA-directed RNA polymerase subunit RPC12/RpoP
MDVVFTCPNCRQELEADAAGAGTEINCPECRFALTIPEPTPQNIKVMPAASQAAAAEADKKEHRISLPKPDKKVKVEISRPKPSLEVAAKGVDKMLRIKTFLREDYAAHGPGAFDKAVSDFLQSVGDGNIHAVMPVQYSHVDPVSKQTLEDFGVVVYHRA